MIAVSRVAAITAHAYGTGAAGEHTLDSEFGPVTEGVAVFVEIPAPTIVMLEQQLCQSWNIYGEESTGLQGCGKGLWRQPAHGAGVQIYASASYIFSTLRWPLQVKTMIDFLVIPA